jgi:Predicted membrane protein
MSLILSSPFQLSFSRYVSDKIFRRQEDYILPSYTGVLFIIFVIGIFAALLFSSFFLKETSALLVIIFVSTVIMMSGTWIANTLLLGIKRYKTIFVAYFLSYLLIILIAVFIPYKRVEWLLVSFFIGNSVLFFILSAIIVKNYPSNHFIDFSFITKKNEKFMPCLVFASLFYNLGIWIDKFVFWLGIL